MIVRINQFDVQLAEQYAGWEAQGPAGQIKHSWQEDTNAFELLILESDEQSQPLARAFRQLQLRQLLPDVAAALKQPGELIVVRLDGPLAQGELARAYNYLTDPRGYGRFAISPIAKLEEPPGPIVGSIRLQPMHPRLVAMCGDANLGLDRSVRLRIFAVPEELVNPLLDVGETDDERWNEILPRAGYVISTVKGLSSLQIITRRFDSDQTKARLMERLVAGGKR